ncbi:conserved hypothetical protein [Candidatus Desulfarcum epimagneticum]|uniref:histidine kinase n=1 Tax=uncultured Desulfobacteraceae bacterium TaxID=218296 RepID=A0A484HCV6_9BACT|nr:conserved hypothetical protein [uncultured Desulfobacteraceae bacterium]
MGEKFDFRPRRRGLDKEIRKRIRGLEKANEALRRESAERKKAERDARERLEIIRSQREIMDRWDRLTRQSRLAAMGEMAVGIAHEINQPLSIIRAAASGLEEYVSQRAEAGPGEGDGPWERPAAWARKILAQTDRASAVIEGMHAFARDNADSPAASDLRDPAALAASFFKKTFKEDGVDLTLDFSGDALMVRADPQKFSQVVVNLLSNARFSVLEKTGEKKIAVRLFPDREGKTAVLEVTDNGVGMDEKTRERCMESFFTTRKMEEGTGLGLFMVAAIAKEFKMTIDIESAPGKGSTFRVFAPLLTSD